jgi:hypothetical protein
MDSGLRRNDSVIGGSAVAIEKVFIVYIMAIGRTARSMSA